MLRKYLRLLFLGLIILLLFIFSKKVFSTTRTASPNEVKENFQNKKHYIAGEIIVKFKEKPDLKYSALGVEQATKFVSVNSILSDYKLEKMQPLLKNQKKEFEQLIKIKIKTEQKDIIRPQGMEKVAPVDENSDEFKLISRLKADPNVEYAELNYVFTTTLTPNDSLFDQQWALSLTQAESGWDVATGSQDAVIAIIDTGIDYLHEDLNGQIWQNTNEIPSNGLDDDQNGYIDDVSGWDFVDTESTYCVTDEDCHEEDNDPSDKLGHGTHVAGIAGASTNNDIGMAGICWFCQLMNLRTGWKGIDGGGYLDSDAIANAIIYAVDNGADIINMSFGSGDYSSVVADSLGYARNNNVIMVASAGNSSAEGSYFPASLYYVFSIAATDDQDNKAYFSNYGGAIDISAPGENILSLRANGTDMYGDGQHIVNENYYLASGTSMSSPFIAGVFGLAKSLHPSWIEADFKKLIKLAVDSVNSNFYLGFGRINLFKAVSTVLSQAQAVLTFPYEKYKSIFPLDTPIEIKGIAIGEGYKLEYGEGYYPQQWTEIYNQNTPIDTGPYGEVLFNWDVSGLEEKMYTIRLTAYDNQGLTIYSPAFIDLYDPSLGWRRELSSEYSSAPNAADLNNDGKKEIIIVSAQETFSSILNLYVFDSEGNDFFSQNPIVLEGGRGASSTPAIGDIDNDGALEIVVAGEIEIAYPFRNEGVVYIIKNDGTILTGWNPKRVSDGISIESRWCPGWGFDRSCGGFPSSPVLEDLNNDGILEIILLSRYGRLYVFDLNGNNLPGFPLLLGEGFWFGNTFNTPAVGDVDGDGFPEISVALGENNQPEEGTFIYLLKNDGSIISGWPKKIVGDNTVYSYYSSLYSSPVMGDVDSDGAKEIFVSSWNEEEGKIHGWKYTGEVINNNWPVSAPGVFWNVSLGKAENEVLILAGAAGDNIGAYGFSSQGILLSGWPPQNSPEFIYGQPLAVNIDQQSDQEFIFTAALNSRAFAYKESGQNASNWPAQIIQSTYRTPTIVDLDQDGLLEIITTGADGKIYVKKLINTNETEGSWNTFHHDARHTGVYTDDLCIPGDCNCDGTVGLQDLICILNDYSETVSQSCDYSDVNKDQKINFFDAGFVIQNFGASP